MNEPPNDVEVTQSEMLTALDAMIADGSPGFGAAEILQLDPDAINREYLEALDPAALPHG